MGIGGGGRKGNAGEVERGGEEAGLYQLADAGVHCLALSLTNSFIFRNEEVELVIWAGDGSYLILLVDEIS